MFELVGVNEKKPKSMELPLDVMMCEVFGGPYHQIPEGYLGVKMAKEINMPSAVNCPTEDFSTPEPALFDAALMNTLHLILAGQKVYIGCMGGTGRTGIMLAVLTKVSMKFENIQDVDPIQYVRDNFNPHAVETAEQRRFVEEFDVSDHVDLIRVHFGYRPMVKISKTFFERIGDWVFSKG